MRKILFSLCFLLVSILPVNAAFLGTWEIDDYLTFYVNTHNAADGVATDADSAPAYRIYEDETGTAIANATMAKLDDANTKGFYSERVQLTSGTGYETGKCYTIYISATINGREGTIHHTFQVESAGGSAYDDDFTGTNGDAPNTVLWAELDDDDEMDIQSNKLNYAYTGTAWRAAEVASKWHFPADTDFEVRIDFDVTTLDDPLVDDPNSLKLFVNSEPTGGGANPHVLIGRGRNDSDNAYYSKSTGSATRVWAGGTDASGKLRLRKTGTAITVWYWDSGDSRWEWDDAIAGRTFSDDFSGHDLAVSLTFRHGSTAGATTVDVNFDNFTIAIDDLLSQPTVNVVAVGGTVQTANDNGADINAILVDTNEMQGKLPTNNIMGSSVLTPKDDEIDAIKAKTDNLKDSWNDPSTAEIQTELEEDEASLLDDIKDAVLEIMGPSFNPNTDSLEAIRDQGDQSWTTR